MHGQTGHSYTKHRHKQLQSHFSTFLSWHVHSFTSTLGWRNWQKHSADSGLFTPVNGESVNECTVSDDVEKKRTNTDSEVINMSELGPDWWDELDTTAQTEHHHHHSSFSGGTKRRLMDRGSWSGEKLWDHGICFRNVNVFLFDFFFFFFLVKCSF